MSITRISAVLLHTWYHFIHSMETWVDLFWSPIIQIWVYALIALSISRPGNPGGLFIMVGMVFWNVIWVGQYAIAVGALWEIWSLSFSGLFITPLTMTEFIVGQMISGFIKSLMAVIVSAIVAYAFYHFSILSLGWMVTVYYIELLVFSWALGLMVLSLIFRYSTQVQSLSWAIVFLVQPFGAVFYPVTVLPPVIRWFSYGLPVTYVFETIRGQLTAGQIDWSSLAAGSLINVAWFTIGVVIFHKSYAAAKRNGAFARLEG